ncbi:SDR family oxidoreductase [Rhizobium hidalgonense]|uniref:NAD(P)-dependent oxidoreductase n=1 Tax=Rhizobium hidalgonense TaxID=1538159 RepID=UPI000FEC801D|nr:SDR family oxidoreductase [Rhizobium hidalgonense]RWX11784.1 SDR family oxidoreductase [Rhizobium hidalgonense]
MHSLVPETQNIAAPKILILGATGPTGRHIVTQAHERGYDVTTLVRSLEKEAHLRGVKFVVGDARDEATLRQALNGRDAVISALGTPASPFKEVTFLSTATRALITAMKAEQVPRLIAITGIGAGDSAGHGGFLFDKLIFPALLRKVYADKKTVIRDSGLDWTIVRPSILNNKQARGTIHTFTDLSKFHGGGIARQDVARFVVDQIATDVWMHKSPLITW